MESRGQSNSTYNQDIQMTIVSKVQRATRIRTYVIILRRSLQSRSPALEDWTRPAVIAASRIIWQPMASHAAGTVSHTSAAPWHDECSKEVSKMWVSVSVLFTAQENVYTPRSATAPISRVICCLAYSQIQERKSIIRSIAFLPGYTRNHQKSYFFWKDC